MSSVSKIDESYKPHEDEPFMNERQKKWFKSRLLEWKQEILEDSSMTVSGMQESTTLHADLTDRASDESDRSLELRARDRQRKLITKIDAALRRIETDEYGYCEATGDPINLRRLIARPTATLSIAAQEAHERKEKVYRDE